LKKSSEILSNENNLLILYEKHASKFAKLKLCQINAKKLIKNYSKKNADFLVEKIKDGLDRIYFDIIEILADIFGYSKNTISNINFFQVFFFYIFI